MWVGAVITRHWVSITAGDSVFFPSSHRPQTLTSEVSHYCNNVPGSLSWTDSLKWNACYLKIAVFSFSFLHLSNASVWKIALSILSFRRKIELYKISEVCVSNATLLLIKLSPYRVGKASHIYLVAFQCQALWINYIILFS